MADPIDSVSDEEFRRQLLWLRRNYGTVVDSPRLRRLIRGVKSQKGISNPTGSPYAIWVRQTLRGVDPDEEPRYFADGSWTFRYSPEGRGGLADMNLDTIRALLRGMKDRVPVGVMRQQSDALGYRGYEILGLAFVEDFDGTHFVLRGESISWTELPMPQPDPMPLHRVEETPAKLAPQLRHLRDQRFMIAVRKAYHERCSLCEVGDRKSVV